MSSLIDFHSNGYAIIEQCLLPKEIERIIELLGSYASTPSAASYAIRRVLVEIPELVDVLAQSAVVPLLTNLLGKKYKRSPAKSDSHRMHSSRTPASAALG